VHSEDAARSLVEDHLTKINRLRTTITNLVTIQQVIFWHDKLSKITPEKSKDFSAEELMDVDATTTAMIISYGRLFSESNGVPVIKKKVIPCEVLAAHEELMELRHQKYAHHGGHESTAAKMGITVFEKTVELKLYWSSEIHHGTTDHWKKLFEWLADFLAASFRKQQKHLSDITGKDWLSFDPKMSLDRMSVIVRD